MKLFIVFLNTHFCGTCIKRSPRGWPPDRGLTIDGFSIKCRKTKTKVIITPNQRWVRKLSQWVMRTQSAWKRERANGNCFYFCIWLVERGGASLLNKPQSQVKKDRYNLGISLDNHLKIVVFLRPLRSRMYWSSIELVQIHVFYLTYCFLRDVIMVLDEQWNKENEQKR